MTTARQGMLNRAALEPRPGFTLLEMIVALSIGVVLMISLYSVLDMQVRQAQGGRQILQEGTLARSIHTRIASDILAALSAAALPATPPSSGGGSAASSAAANSSAANATSANSNSPSSNSANSSSANSSSPSGTTTGSTGPGIVFNNGVYGTNNVLVLTVSKVPFNMNGNLGSSVAVDPTQQASNCDLRRVSYWIAGGGLAVQEVSQPTSADLSTVPPDVADGSYKILASEVKDITFQYWDGASWNDSWDGTTLGGPTGELPIGPPSAIKITLTMSRPGASGTESTQSKYSHVVAIPGGNNFPSTSQ
jgi:prepilin-type N-terminal cleavage/methylation domain-containing protein